MPKVDLHLNKGFMFTVKEVWDQVCWLSAGKKFKGSKNDRPLFLKQQAIVSIVLYIVYIRYIVFCSRKPSMQPRKSTF